MVRSDRLPRWNVRSRIPRKFRLRLRKLVGRGRPRWKVELRATGFAKTKVGMERKKESGGEREKQMVAKGAREKREVTTTGRLQHRRDTSEECVPAANSGEKKRWTGKRACELEIHFMSPARGQHLTESTAEGILPSVLEHRRGLPEIDRTVSYGCTGADSRGGINAIISRTWTWHAGTKGGCLWVIYVSRYILESRILRNIMWYVK